MVVTVIFTLVINDPWLSYSTIWFISINVLELDKLISEYIHSISSESILEFFGCDVVVESLIVETFPVIDNHVFVESFEESTTNLTNWF